MPEPAVAHPQHDRRSLTPSNGRACATRADPAPRPPGPGRGRAPRARRAHHRRRRPGDVRRARAGLHSAEVSCATELPAAARRLGLELRASLYSGEVELRGDDVAGIAVHTAARVQSEASAGEVLVSRTVVDLVAGSGLSFDDRGVRTLKGVPGEWQLYAVA